MNKLQSCPSFHKILLGICLRVFVCVHLLIPDLAMLAIRSSEEESTEMEEMDTSEPNWCWFYLAECGVWHMFEVAHTITLRITLYSFLPITPPSTKHNLVFKFYQNSGSKVKDKQFCGWPQIFSWWLIQKWQNKL